MDFELEGVGMPEHLEPTKTARRDLSRPVLFALTVFLLTSNVALYFVYKGNVDQLAERTRQELGAARESGAGETQHTLDTSSVPEADPGLAAYRIVNAHDHLYQQKHLDKYLAAAERLGIVRTVLVASSDYTLKGEGNDPRRGNAWNTNEILTCEHAAPDKIVTYCAIHPDDENKEDLLRQYLAAGVHGLKLYTGHSNFYDRPLDDPVMMPVYEFCEQNNFPICWHINLSKPNFLAEFLRVMERFPRLKVIVPHFGVTFYRPGGEAWNQFWQILDQYPGVYTDCSWGTRNILVHGLEVVSANVPAFRDAIIKYQDRILWGTDMVVTGNAEKTEAWIESVLRACREMLEKDVYYFWMAADGSPYDYPGTKNPYGQLRGLALEPDVLRKIYETNYDAFVALRPGEG